VDSVHLIFIDREYTLSPFSFACGSGSFAEPQAAISVFYVLTTIVSRASRSALSLAKKPDTCGCIAVWFASSDNKIASTSWKSASICCSSTPFGDDIVEVGIIQVGIVEAGIIEEGFIGEGIVGEDMIEVDMIDVCS
jgi:hypothetical protein